MSRIKTLAALAALGLGAAACATPGTNQLTAAQQSQPLFGPPAGGRAHRLRVRRRTPTATASPTPSWSGSPPGSTRSSCAMATASVDRRAAAAIRPARAPTSPGSLAEYGLLLERRRAGHAGRGPAGLGPGRRQPRDARACPAARTGRRAPASTPQHAPSSNYGCAINSNLAAMIANPDDLVHGQAAVRPAAAAPPPDARSSVYREAQPTGRQGLPTTTTTIRAGKTMNAPFHASRAASLRDPFTAFVCDEATAELLRPIAVEHGWSPEKVNKGGLRNAVQTLSVSASPTHPVRRPLRERRSAERHQRARRGLRARHGGDRRRPGQRRPPLSRPRRHAASRIIC